ncbi:hypothetical protein QYM36_019347 [Artemia franciscana]|uniref:C2H2-type domain-containing protein n=1 Tax=Artemia franciscana TaxID=6661 RepID=A0AA88H5E1_ARTSF|nr:hypothetical protein QYM36_019347 [Artemia franciscana]
MHTVEKPLMCDVCDQTFSQTVHMNTHKRTHTDEKLFACGVCDKAFSRAAIETEAAESVASCLSKEREKEILENRQYVKALLKTTALLGRQGLAFRGHDEGESSANQGNFVETVHLLTEINPDLMKNSRKEKRSDPENYRPISLTSPFLKIMERVIVEKLNSHLELNTLISDHQHGFRKNRSTVSQLVIIHDYIQSTLDHGIPIDIILIDLLKAFDRISLRKLIHCLEVYGIKGQLKNWLSAYLNDRKIAVKVADTLSTWTDATSGVPQDDTKLLGEASASSQIQSDLDALTEKLEEWQLSPNLAKCSVVHLGRQNPMYSYKMKGIGPDKIYL